MNLEKRAIIAASGQVLTELLPEDYEEHEDIDQWMVDRAWEPYENWCPSMLWSQISDVAYSLKAFHENELKQITNN